MIDPDDVLDSDIRERAYRAYFRRFGKTADPPGSASRWEGDWFVVLRNDRGVELARYLWDDKRDELRYVRKAPGVAQDATSPPTADGPAEPAKAAGERKGEGRRARVSKRPG